jgi:hypothetical protein
MALIQLKEIKMSNYSAEELERQAYINGDTNTANLLGTIADWQHGFGELSDIPDIQEILCQLPEEDFLEGVMSMLRKINVRGDNKTAINKIIEELDEIQLQQARATEYARSLK